MTQLRDAVRQVGRTVVLVDDDGPVAAHVQAAGAGGLTIVVDGESRFIGPDQLHGIELDGDLSRMNGASQ